MSEPNRNKEIGTVCGIVRGDDGVMRYQIFNGFHHEKPSYYYAPVGSPTQAPLQNRGEVG